LLITCVENSLGYLLSAWLL